MHSTDPSLSISPPPLCFVLMPFGRKADGVGRMVDFDAVYRDLVKPAITAAGMEPLRADEEEMGGMIHKPMFERLILCDYAVADLTTANANVFYELGLRHGVRPWSTVLLFAEGARIPFDVAPVRALPYQLNGKGQPLNLPAAQQALSERLHDARNAVPDSPVFQLVDDLRPHDIDRLKTDTFRDRVQLVSDMKRRLAQSRRDGADAVRAVAKALVDTCPIRDTEAGVVLDLFLSLRAVKAWEDMVSLVEQMSPPLARTVLVQEQLAFALNRAGKSEDAEQVLLQVLAQHGASSETNGLLGRVYKDRWDRATSEGKHALAAGLLRQAILAYRRGFEADWRDAYPGINAVTLMALQTPPDPAGAELLPIVRYAVNRRLAASEPDYWDHATQLELAVLARDEVTATTSLSDCLAVVRESWEPETTARNLRLIREARARRGETVEWAYAAETSLLEAAEAPTSGRA